MATLTALCVRPWHGRAAGQGRWLAWRLGAVAVVGVLAVPAALWSAPSAAWSTFLGGDAYEEAKAVAMDGDGNAIVAGVTSSAGWTTSGLDDDLDGASDAFVAKFAASGELLWARLLGGSEADDASGVAVDGSGNIFVTGRTKSANWVAGGYDTSFNGDEDAFVVKLNAAGAVLWSTYVGGTLGDTASRIAVDDQGAPAIAGQTVSAGWISGGAVTERPGGNDGFVVRLTADGAFVWSSYVGGSLSDACNGIAFDSVRAVYVVGTTESAGWVAGGFDTAFAGPQDAFLVKFTATGGALWSTYLGSAGGDFGSAVEVLPDDAVAVGGETSSDEWVSGGGDSTYGGGATDAFVACLSSAGVHQWSTLIGGSDAEFAVGLRRATTGLWFAAQTYSAGLARNGFDTSANGGNDAFIARLTAASGEHIWSSYIGGNSAEFARDMAAGPGGTACVVGGTWTAEWVAGGADTTYGGSEDGFAAMVNDAPAYTLHVQSAPSAGVTITSSTGHGGVTGYTLMPLWSGTAVELTAPAVLIWEGQPYVLSAWTGVPDGSVISPDGRTLTCVVVADAAPVASYRLAVAVPAAGPFAVPFGRDQVGDGRGLWDLTGLYATEAAGDPLTLELVHDVKGKISGTATCQVASKTGKITPVVLSVKGSAKGSGGAVAVKLTLKGADASGSLRMAVAYRLAIDAESRQLRGSVSGSRRSEAGTVPIAGDVTLDLPAPLDGTWELRFDLATSGTAVTGDSTLALSNGVEHPLLAKGKMAGPLALLALAGAPDDLAAKGLKMKVGLEPLEGGQGRLVHLSGKAYGQSLAW